MDEKKGLTKQTYISMAVLTASNLFALVGVLYLGWSSLLLLLTYWVESAIIGFYTLLKMRKTKNLGNIRVGPGRINASWPGEIRNNTWPIPWEQMKVPKRRSVILFFLFVYGLFMFGYLVFIIFLSIFMAIGFGPESGLNVLGIATPLVPAFSVIVEQFKSFIILAALLFISHGVSYYVNFIKEKEFEKTDISKLFVSSFKRIIPMNVAIVIGFWLGSPAAVLIIIKVAVDIFSHLSEHRKLAMLKLASN